MTTQEKIEVMKAYEDGKTIQAYSGFEWKNIMNPSWDWAHNDYRIKPESTHRPYKDTEEMIADFKKRFNVEVPPHAMPMIWAKMKDDSDFAMLITEFGYSCVWCSCSDIGTPMEKLFADFTYLDGSPCGIKED